MKKFNPYTYKRYPNEPVITPIWGNNICIEDPIEREIADLKRKQSFFLNVPYRIFYYSDTDQIRDSKRLNELEKKIIDDKLLETKQKELELRGQQLMQIKEQMKNPIPKEINVYNETHGDNCPIIGSNNSNVKVGSSGFSLKKIWNFLKKCWALI